MFTEDDFDISEIVAVFSAGEIETSVSISITNDLILEQDELFDVALASIIDNPSGVKLGMPIVAEVSIMNSNSTFCEPVWLGINSGNITYHFIGLTVMFSQQQYSVNESDGQVTVGLELSRSAGQSLTIGVRSIPNTAQGNCYIDIISKLPLITRFGF